MVDSNKVNAFITALANKFENKVANKKDNINGDFSSDSVSYPTVKAVKNFFGTKITSWSGTASDSNYPSEKLVKNELDGKISKSNTAGLVKNDGTIDTTTYLSQHQDISGKANSADLSAVATSGSYDDLTDKPDIPIKTSDLTNDADGTNGATYVLSTDNRLTNSRTPTSHTHGSITNDGKIGSDSGKIITTGDNGVLQASSSITKSMISDFPSSMTPSSHEQATSTITNATAFNNIKSGESTILTLDTQAKINSAINDKLGVLEGLKFIEITTDKGTASASTMNKLYIENKNSKTDIYYTEQSGSSYLWVKLEDNIMEDITIPVVYDDLDSDDATKALSAKQGKALNTDKISKVANNTNVLLADGTNIAQSTFSASGHTHNYTTTADVDTEIEAYLDAITNALTS